MATIKLTCTKVIDLNSSFFFTEGGQYTFEYDDENCNSKFWMTGFITTNIGERVVAKVSKYSAKAFSYMNRHGDVCAHFEEVK